MAGGLSDDDGHPDHVAADRRVPERSLAWMDDVHPLFESGEPR
jgi:hypothetical protein